MEHVRIDRGIKRKTRKGIVTKPSAKQDLGSWQIPPDLDPKEVIELYMTESTTSRIAERYGVSRKALTKWLRLTVPKEWKQAQIIRALARKEDADEGLEDAVDALSLAKARELLRSAQFDLEHLDEDFRPKQENIINTTPLFIVNLAPQAESAKLIE